jgi:hypothetical protein
VIFSFLMVGVVEVDCILTSLRRDDFSSSDIRWRDEEESSGAGSCYGSRAGRDGRRMAALDGHRGRYLWYDPRAASSHQEIIV